MLGVVLCVDEKTQIQALTPTAPILPMIPGVPERRSSDYERHGTTNLYAALDAASGKVIARTADRARAVEFLEVPGSHRRARSLNTWRCI